MPGSARALLCPASPPVLGSSWLHPTAQPQTSALHLTMLLRIQYLSAAGSQARPGTQQGPNRWQPGCLLFTGLGSLPHCGLTGGKSSMNTCNGLLDVPHPQPPPLQRAESSLPGQLRLGANAGGRDWGRLPGGSGFSC